MNIKKTKFYIANEDKFLYDKEIGFFGYWDISKLIYGCKWELSQEEIISKIGFLPTWNDKSIEICNFKEIKKENCIYYIVGENEFRIDDKTKIDKNILDDLIKSNSLVDLETFKEKLYDYNIIKLS